MRNEAKQSQRIQYVGIQSYHHRDTIGGGREAYASQGFSNGFRIANSDRFIEPNETIKSYGVEIELCSRINSDLALGIILEKVVFPAFPAGLFKQQSDCSLDGNSTSEVITLPMTKAFIRNHYNDFKAMWMFLADIGTAPNNSCGMHTNISLACFGKTREKQLKAIQTLNDWMYDNYNFAARLFKRELDHTMYCQRRYRGRLDNDNDHGAMCNYSHMDAGTASRVEIRLVGPQKTFQSFRNTMETIFWLVEAANTGRDFSDVVKLFKGCNECVLDRLKDTMMEGYITREQYDAIKAASVDAGIRVATSN